MSSSFGLRNEEAEDVVQDVFLSLFRHLRLGRSRSHLRGWLFRVAHNLALKQRTSLQRRQANRSWDDTAVAAAGRSLAGPRIATGGPAAAATSHLRAARAAGARSAVHRPARGGPALPRDRGSARHFSGLGRQVPDSFHHAARERKRTVISMAHHTHHPSDETLLRAVDGEHSPRRLTSSSGISPAVRRAATGIRSCCATRDEFSARLP